MLVDILEKILVNILVKMLVYIFKKGWTIFLFGKMLNVLSTSRIFVVLERLYEPGAWWALYIHFCTYFFLASLPRKVMNDAII
jgi:hypothetical protein